MSRHTTMPVRKQRTPFGEVSLASRWMRDEYYFQMYGDPAAVRWLAPKAERLEACGDKARFTFKPYPVKIAVMRDLIRAAGKIQERWTERLLEHELTGTSSDTVEQPLVDRIRTLGQLFDHLYERRLTSVTRATADRDRYRLKVWRDTLGNDLPLALITADVVADKLSEVGKRTSAVTANTALGVLKTYLTWAANMALLKDNSHKTVKRLRESAAARHQRAWWTKQEVELALRCAAKDAHQPTATLLVACGCYLGLRPEEIIMSRWQDLDLDAVDPATNKPKPVCHVIPHSGWKPKDGEPRDVPICDELLGILKQHRRDEGFLLNREPHRTGRPRGGKGWIYRYDPKATWARLMRAVVSAGGKAITLYGMRHSFASNHLIANTSDVKVARWLGHTDTRMVHKHYGHLLSYDDDINAAYRSTQH